MVTTNKHILEFLDDYDIVENCRVSRDFTKTFRDSKQPGIKSGTFMRTNYVMIVNTPEHEVEFYIDTQDYTIEIAIKTIVDDKSIVHKFSLIVIGTDGLKQTVNQMLLNLT